MNLNQASFNWPIRVYYEDTDAGGVVYHATYLHFMERARTEWLRDLGFEQDQLRIQNSIIFVVRHANIDYIAPARFNDQLLVSAQLTKIGRASLIVMQQIQIATTKAILCTGTFKIVCVRHPTFRPIALPATLRSTLENTDATA
jgi:acyl-CoA thioester hydrolase